MITCDDEASSTNMALLNDIISKRKEMILEAVYPVVVTLSKKEGRARSVQTEVRQIRRRINIHRIALVFIEGYWHMRGEQVLSSHHSMMRKICRLALFFREIFINAIDEADRPPRAKHNSTMTGDGDDEDRAGSAERTERESNGNPHASVGRILSLQQTGTIIPSITVVDLKVADREREREMLEILRVTEETFDKLKSKERSY